jgi:hypothetical protein
MKKTVLKKFTEITAIPAHSAEDSSIYLTDLVKELKTSLKEAASDLLQPRPEAISRLLNKVLH